ncbi:hypothetical protein YC2023_101667 [Brassica napus]
MLSQKWDPGIGYELHNGAEDQQRKDLGGSELRSSDLRRFEWVFETWNWGFLRMLRVFNWSMISIVIKTELWRFTGIISAYKNIMFPYPMKGNIRSDQGFALIEIWRYWICYHHEWLWKMADWIFNDEIGFEIYVINGRRYGIEELENRDYYKTHIEPSLCCISLSFSLATISNKEKVFPFLFTMTQSQLLGNGGDMKEGETARKRMKISVPHFDNSALIKTYSKSLIGRCMNPPEQEMKALIQNVPKIWKLEERVVGTDLGFGKFRFDFETEEEIDTVLKLQPYHFDYWMLALARWQPKKSQLFPSEITFWIMVIGVPMEFRTVPTFESLGDALGRTVAVDVEHCRVQVVVDAFQELCFETTLDFKGGEFYEGEEAAISLRYEKLFGYCPLCSSLCHKEEKCPLAKKALPEKKREGREGNGGWYDGGKHDDRARSYKGVVINGNQNQQHKERDGRDYYGKGKGKMVEEADSKWVKVADRGNKGPFTNHRSFRGEGDGSRHRSSRREEPRAEGQGQGGSNRSSSGQSGAPKEVVQEEGEIKNPKESEKTLPSQDFQEELAKTQAVGSEVILDPMDAEEGLQMIKT